ncbi:RHS repeat-associated core domain-containing protein [Pseudofulvibacter geojedonensis]|uniref:RHS repeat-associated core domain-containing protein n=1 Tax=Pseudofulvibacter geojedonensis TaxID=1123758 RepID=A0ABW3I0V2_9FLAO
MITGRQHKYGYNGKEENQELGLEWMDFGARNYDAALGRWMNLDPQAETMPTYSPYNFAFNNPVYFVDPDGERPCPNGDCGGAVIAVFYHGGPFGGGKTTTADKAGGTGNIYNNAKSFAGVAGREFKGTIIAPGLTSASGTETGLDFIRNNYSDGDQVIIYGYSYGVDVAVDLAEELKELGIDVDLLVTVDGSDGPLQNTTVNTDIPDNVDTNLNVYQDEDSGTSNASPGVASGSTGASSSGPPGASSGSASGSSSGKSSGGSSGSSSPSSNSPGSNGGPNSAVNSEKTNVINKNITGKGVTHGNIQQKAQNIIQPLINTRINNYQ